MSDNKKLITFSGLQAQTEQIISLLESKVWEYDSDTRVATEYYQYKNRPSGALQENTISADVYVFQKKSVYYDYDSNTNVISEHSFDTKVLQSSKYDSDTTILFGENKATDDALNKNLVSVGDDATIKAGDIQNGGIVSGIVNNRVSIVGNDNYFEVIPNVANITKDLTVTISNSMIAEGDGNRFRAWAHRINGMQGENNVTLIGDNSNYDNYTCAKNHFDNLLIIGDNAYVRTYGSYSGGDAQINYKTSVEGNGADIWLNAYYPDTIVAEVDSKGNKSKLCVNQGDNGDAKVVQATVISEGDNVNVWSGNNDEATLNAKIVGNDCYIRPYSRSETTKTNSSIVMVGDRNQCVYERKASDTLVGNVTVEGNDAVVNLSSANETLDVSITGDNAKLMLSNNVDYVHVGKVKITGNAPQIKFYSGGSFQSELKQYVGISAVSESYGDFSVTLEGDSPQMVSTSKVNNNVLIVGKSPGLGLRGHSNVASVVGDDAIVRIAGYSNVASIAGDNSKVSLYSGDNSNATITSENVDVVISPFRSAPATVTPTNIDITGNNATVHLYGGDSDTAIRATTNVTVTGNNSQILPNAERFGELNLIVTGNNAKLVPASQGYFNCLNLNASVTSDDASIKLNKTKFINEGKTDLTVVGERAIVTFLKSSEHNDIFIDGDDAQVSLKCDANNDFIVISGDNAQVRRSDDSVIDSAITQVSIVGENADVSVKSSSADIMRNCEVTISGNNARIEHLGKCTKNKVFVNGNDAVISLKASTAQEHTVSVFGNNAHLNVSIGSGSSTLDANVTISGGAPTIVANKPRIFSAKTNSPAKINFTANGSEVCTIQSGLAANSTVSFDATNSQFCNHSEEINISTYKISNATNTADRVTIFGGTTTNLNNSGNYVSIVGGTKADSIVNSGKFVTIFGGAGNDTFYNYGTVSTFYYSGNVTGGKDSITNWNDGDLIYVADSDVVISDSSGCNLIFAKGSVKTTLQVGGANTGDTVAVKMASDTVRTYTIGTGFSS